MLNVDNNSYVEEVKAMWYIAGIVLTLLLRPTRRLSCVADSHHLDTKANQFVTSIQHHRYHPSVRQNQQQHDDNCNICGWSTLRCNNL